VLCAGDLSYADGWAELWDSFGRMIQPLASRIPFLTTGGNHEVGLGENWLSYKARYPTPHKGSGSNNFCYWGKEVGVVHVIALCSYAGFQTDSLQYQWLSQYLSSKIDREKTPWVAVMLHTPLYNSNNGHWMEGELMRLSIEPLFYNYGVDFVLAGHVHSYERTLPMYNSTVDPCGTVYLNIGDGGNYEGVFAGNFKSMHKPSLFNSY
jgi:3',5'-cyclic AMP phosphodiesterase CpdA